MKKLFILLFALTITIPTFAGLKSKDIVGKWKYEMTISNSEIDGSFNFSEKTGKQKGKAIQSDGRIFPLSKIKVNKKNNTLSFKFHAKMMLQLNLF